MNFLLKIFLLTTLMMTTTSLALSFHHIVRGQARFFLDTAVESEWNDLLPLGIFHGVTTNPVLLERAGHPCTIPHIQSLASKVLNQSNEFMCQAWGDSSDELYQVGKRLSALDPQRVVIKVPVTKQGTVAASQLIASGVRVCLTACYSSNQALIATGVGAEYLAPYLGRMNDSGINGMDECVKMQQIVNGLKGKTRILVASIRSVESMAQLAMAGLDTFTFSPDVARALFLCPQTDRAALDFEAAAARGSKK
jgi:transaldolase